MRKHSPAIGTEKGPQLRRHCSEKALSSAINALSRRSSASSPGNRGASPRRRADPGARGRNQSRWSRVSARRQSQAQGGIWICAPITEASKVYPLPLWRDVFAELRPDLAGKAVLLVGSDDQRGALDELGSLLRRAGVENAKVHLPEDLVEIAESHRGGRNGDDGRHGGGSFRRRPGQTLRHPLLRAAPGHVRTRGNGAPGSAGCCPQPPQGKTKFKWHAGIQPARVAATVRELLEFPPQPPRSAHSSCSG